jgi:hypothetical protein
MSKFLRLASVICVGSMVGCVAQSQDPVYSKLYEYDRTLSLKDIAPIIPAYVDRPFVECDKEKLLRSESVRSVINGPKSERVYIVEGKRCVLR